MKVGFWRKPPAVVDAMGHGAPAADMTPNRERALKQKIANRLFGEQIKVSIDAAKDLFAIIVREKVQLATLHEGERVLLAEELEQAGKMAYQVAAVLRGKETT